jgi:hypothetical protein
MVRVVAVFVAFCVSAVTFGAQEAPRGATPQAARAFSRALVQAMASRDRAAVARMVKYPARADVGGFEIPLVDRAGTLEVYSLVFTPELRCEIERTAPTIDASGAMLAGRRVRVVNDGGTLRIARIAVPPASGSAPPPPSKPQQAYFRRGKAQFAGRLYGDGVDSYLVFGRKGARLEARIERFPGRAAFVRVLEPRAGKALERPGAQAPRTWAGTLTEEGQYRVEIVRLAPYCEPPFTYLLTMTLR